MCVSQRVLLLLLASAFLCSKSYAPIYGTYPGLHSLIKQAEVIAAITILQQLSEPDFGGAARYKIQIEKVFKGTASEKQTTAYLRQLQIIPESELLRSPSPQPPSSIRYFAPPEGEDDQPFPVSTRWVAFLTKARSDVKAVYENVNCSGSTFPLSPLRDLDTLKVDSLPDTLTVLFREYVDYKRTVLKEFEKQLDAFIHQRDE
jgi:hypothetical protein